MQSRNMLYHDRYGSITKSQCSLWLLYNWDSLQKLTVIYSDVQLCNVYFTRWLLSPCKDISFRRRGGTGDTNGQHRGREFVFVAGSSLCTAISPLLWLTTVTRPDRTLSAMSRHVANVLVIVPTIAITHFIGGRCRVMGHRVYGINSRGVPGDFETHYRGNTAPFSGVVLPRLLPWYSRGSGYRVIH